MYSLAHAGNNAYGATSPVSLCSFLSFFTPGDGWGGGGGWEVWPMYSFDRQLKITLAGYVY